MAPAQKSQSDKSLLLSLDTTTRFLGVSIFEEGKELVSSFEESDSTAELVISCLLKTLSEVTDRGFEAVSELYVGLGPGSYTGIRTGVSAVMGIAFARGAKLCGVSNLLAECLPHIQTSGTYTIIKDASPEDYFSLSLNINLESKTISQTSPLAVIKKSSLNSEPNLIDISATKNPAPLLPVISTFTLHLNDKLYQTYSSLTPLEPLYIKPANALTLAERGK